MTKTERFSDSAVAPPTSSDGNSTSIRMILGDNYEMTLTFTKMQGAGNDFIVVDATREPFVLTQEQVRRIADRRFGIGADQILIVEPSPAEGIDFRYRIFNADGGEVEQCGNGARCFARFVVDKGLTSKQSIRVMTLAGVIEPRLEADGQVTVDMGVPVTDLPAVPFDPSLAVALPACAQQAWFELPLTDAAGKAALIDDAEVRAVAVGPVSMGNPHAVMLVPDVDTAPVAQLGPLVERHVSFPRRVNAGFMQIVDRHHVRLRVFERGAGETLACGTGACAAVVVGIRSGLLDSPVQLQARGGELSIAWAGEGSPVMMTGPAVTVFEGSISLE